MTRNSGRNTDGTFAPGNGGKPPGSRHRATQAVLALLDGEAEALTRKAVEMVRTWRRWCGGMVEHGSTSRANRARMTPRFVRGRRLVQLTSCPITGGIDDPAPFRD